MCQLDAADCLILILNDICSVVSEAASCHYGAPMWTKQKPSIELTTEHINMMQAVRLTVQTCFIVQAQAQTGTFFIHVYFLKINCDPILLGNFCNQQNVGLFSGEIGNATSLRIT